MLDSSDFDQMRADLLDIRDDHPAEITLRRGTNTLSAQTVRIVRLASQAQEWQGAAAAEVRARVLVVGATTLDIQPGDRFTDQGTLYQVTFVRPNRSVATSAEAEAVQ